VSANLLKRTFDVRVANTVWASAITGIWTREGWIYLAVVLDAYSRRIVGYSMKRRPGRAIVVEALQMALRARHVRCGLIHHSDRGSQYASSQYASSEYQGLPRTASPHGSMSSTGSCYDNAGQLLR
jgi:transposase InsO family protein